MFKLPIFTIEPLISETFKQSMDHWFDIISTEYNFRMRRKTIKKQVNGLIKSPWILGIEGTNICNAKCIFCAYTQMERPKKIMPMQDFKDIIVQYVAIGGQYVSLTPIVGDPFMDNNIFERLDFLYTLPEIRRISFYTNGILMKPQISQRLLDYDRKLTIHISIGGFDRETYTSIMGIDMFDVVRYNIEALIEQKLNSGSSIDVLIALRCPPSKWTGELWKKLQAWEREEILKIHSINTFDSWAGKVKEECLKKVGLVPIKKPYKRGACEMLYFKPIVLANGEVNACYCRDVEAELIIGDLKKSTLSDILAGRDIEELIERHEYGDFPDVCKRCTKYISIYNRHSENSGMKHLFHSR
jgi:sulfatase maturation enzyme AslB (radical SAM superfamily)